MARNLILKSANGSGLTVFTFRALVCISSFLYGGEDMHLQFFVWVYVLQRCYEVRLLTAANGGAARPPQVLWFEVGRAGTQSEAQALANVAARVCLLAGLLALSMHAASAFPTDTGQAAPFLCG